MLRAVLVSSAATAVKPPPMGFSSWNKFGMGITVPVLLEVTEAFTSSGLQAAGYTYMCSDDGWMYMVSKGERWETDFFCWPIDSF